MNGSKSLLFLWRATEREDNIAQKLHIGEREIIVPPRPYQVPYRSQDCQGNSRSCRSEWMGTKKGKRNEASRERAI
jgi:hypothetical protein